MSDLEQKQACPCNNEKTYEKCCKKYHEGQLPENALLLMRSRYSAYALNLPEYIIKTTHPASPHYSENKFSWKRNISKFSNHSEFNQLEILDFKEKDNLATVTFTAHITQGNQDATYTEKSCFEKIEDKWFYRNGHLSEGHTPTMMTRGQLRMLPLAYYGDPILRKKAESVSEITEEIKSLIQDMIETMDVCNGLGLAAPQVHHSLRIFVLRVPVEIEKGHYEPGEAQIFINPVLSSHNSETWKYQEGCLSIPTIHGTVERSTEVTVEYTDMNGQKQKKQISGLEARAVMHENDHLDGVLLIDHLSNEERKQLEPFLKNLKKRIHDGTEL